MADAPMNAEPRLSLWCAANPDCAAAEIEQLRRDLSHAKACTEVWMNRFRKADAALSPADSGSQIVSQTVDRGTPKV